MDDTAGPFGSQTVIENVSEVESPSASVAVHVYVWACAVAVGAPAIVRVDAVHVIPRGSAVGESA